MKAAGYETSLFGKLHVNNFCKDLRSQRSLAEAHGYSIVDELPGPRTYATFKSSYYDYLENKGLLEVYRQDMERRYRYGHVYDSSPTPLEIRDYADVYIAERAIDYLSGIPTGRKWLCTVSFGGPHDPWDTPAKYKDLYSNNIPPKSLDKPFDMNPDRPKGVYDEILNGKYDPGLTNDILGMTEKDIMELRRSYYGHVTLIDEQIGRIIGVLKDRGLYEDTMIVFTSDHGEQNGDYGLLFKQTFFESSVRVPLIIRIPGTEPSKVIGAVSLMDVGPTICEAADVEGEHGHAESLLNAIHAGVAEEKTIISQLFGETMILKNGVKAVVNKEGKIYLLFDLNEDPFEKRNLAGCSLPLERMMEHEYSDVISRIGNEV